MTNVEYEKLKKQEYMSTVGIETIDDDTPEDIRREWFARLNQIKSGHLMKLSHEQIDLYCALEGYEKREFVKSCVYEGVNKDILARIIETDNLEAMKELKVEHYKSDYILAGINSKVNSLYGALDDCEQKFGVFEKYLEQFSEQVSKKDQELSSMKTEIDGYRKKIEQLQEENSSLKLFNSEIKAQNEKLSLSSKPREVVVTRVIKEEKATTPAITESKTDIPDMKSKDNTKEKKNILSGVKQLFNKNIKVVEDIEDDETDLVVGSKTDVAVPTTKLIKSYTKKEDVVTVFGNIEDYILKSELSSEQLFELSKCFVLDISDEQIIAMIENNYSPSQIKNCANVIVSRKNAEKRRMEQLKEEMAKTGAGTVEPPAKIQKTETDTRSLAEMFDEDNENIEEFVDEYDTDGLEEMDD